MSATDWDNDGIPNSKDDTPGQDPNASYPTVNFRMNPVNIPGQPSVGLDESTNWFAASPVNDPESFKILMAKLFQYGHISSPNDFTAAKKVWTELTKMAGSLGSPTGNVEDWIALYPPQGDGDGVSRTKSSMVTQYTPSSAGDTYNTTSKAELGREASAKEMKAYTAAVNERAKKEPTVADITTVTSGGVSSQKGTQGTGFDPTLFARDFARSQEDYAENFAASNFLSLVEQSLRDPNRIGQVI